MKRILVLLCLTLLVYNCGQRQIKVGVAFPVTGEQATLGKILLQGVELAAWEWNQKAGAFGSKIVLVIRDDQADPNKAVTVARELVSKGVIGTIGHMNSDCSIAAAKVYEEAGIPMISPSSTSPGLTDQNFPNVFRTCGRDDAQMQIAAEFICGILKPKKVFLVHDKSIYGETLVKVLKELIGKNIQITGEAVVNRGDTLFPLLIEEIEGLAPDLVFFGGVDPGAGRLVKTMKAKRIKAKFMGGDGLASSGYIEQGGDATEGTYFTFGLPIEQAGSAVHFVRLFKERYQTLNDYAVYAYDAFGVLMQAYCEASGKSLVETLHQINYDGAIGLINFDSKGDMIKAPYMVWTIRDSRMVPWSEESLP